MKFQQLCALSALALAALGFQVQAGPYAQLSSSESQTATTAPKMVTLNSNDALKELTNDKGTITIKQAGSYFLMAAAQIGNRNGGTGTVRLWMRVNGKDVDNSNTEQTVAPGATSVLVCQGIGEFKAGDRVEMFYSASKSEGLGLVASTPKGEPAIPSVIFSAFKTEPGAYAQLSSNQTQAADGTPKLVTLNAVDAAQGVEHDKGTITVKEAGTYFVMAAGQAGATANAGKGNVKLWMRVNGKDVDNSNTEQTIENAFTGVLVCQGLAELKAGDKITLYQSSTGTGVGMVASTPKGEPAIPSMIFSLCKVKTGPYAQLSSTETQTADPVGKVVTLNSVDAAKDVESNKTSVAVKADGAYFAVAAGQVGSTKAEGKGSVKLWMGLGGKAIDNSNTEQTITAGFTSVLVCQGIAELKSGNRLELLQSATGVGLGMIATQPRGEPTIPSMIFSLFQID